MLNIDIGLHPTLLEWFGLRHDLFDMNSISIGLTHEILHAEN